MNFIHKTITTFFGAGYSPIAPGTAGALFGCGFLFLFNYFEVVLNNPFLFIAIILITTLIGIYSTNQLTSEWGKDPSKVVIDEVIGMWISMLLIPFSYLNLLMAFILFRLFDIYKPFGIRKLEQLYGGLGVMADDVLAGIYANLVLQLIIYLL
ncbi:MAG: phosphatidylglycerophosphatase A [Flavobacteriales bacterium]|nr:phosphatidylglycerophosphatase A [Flavobacteriales bacterium]